MTSSWNWRLGQDHCQETSLSGVQPVKLIGAARKAIWQKLVDELANVNEEFAGQCREPAAQQVWLVAKAMGLRHSNEDARDVFDSHLRPGEFHNITADKKALQKSFNHPAIE